MTVHDLSHADAVTKTIGLLDKASVFAFFELIASCSDDKTLKSLKALADPFIEGASFTTDVSITNLLSTMTLYLLSMLIYLITLRYLVRLSLARKRTVNSNAIISQNYILLMLKVINIKGDKSRLLPF